jgi:hypothetical protein
MVANRNVSLTNYDEQLAAAQRRQKLSEMLQEQANAPIDIQSYKGVQAPIPWTAVLAKALQSGVAGYQGKKAAEQTAAIGEQTRKGLSDYLQQSSANYKIPNIQASPLMKEEQVRQPMAQPVGLQSMAPPVGITNGMVESKEHKLAAALAAQGAPQGAAPTAPNPNLVNMTQDLINKQVPVTPPAAGAMVPPAPAPVRPQTISVPDMTPQPAMINRSAADRQQMVLQGIASDNPLIRQVAPSMYDQATKDVDKETMVNAIKKIKVEGADAEMLGAYMASPDPSKAIDYLVSVGKSREEAAAELNKVKLTIAASAEQKQADRELRLYQGNQTSEDRRFTAAQASEDRRLGYQIAAANRRGPQMPTRVQDDLVHKAGLADSAERAFSNFNDRFVGHAVTGEAGVFINRLTGKDPEAANWWQDYKNYQADVIHDRYGGALTTNEVTRYKQYAVTPQMNAKVAKTNLDEQNKIIKTALARKAQGSLALGYDPEGISALIGRDPTSLSVAPPSSPQGNATLIYDPKTGSLVPKK